MAKDERYQAVKALIQTDGIKSFRDIFRFIPKKVVYSDLGINHGRFLKLVGNTIKFSLEELETLSRFIDVDAKIIIDLAYNQALTDRKTKRKSK